MILICSYASSTAQVKKIKSHYKEADKIQKTGVVSFVQPFLNLVDNYGSLQQIILIRHGEPAIERKGWVNRTGLKQFFMAYDSVGVKQLKNIPVMLYPKDICSVYTSNLNRAKHTAMLCFGDSLLYVEDSLFREFERKALHLPNIKLPLGFWKSSSRFFWLLGLNDNNIESFKEAKQRAKEGSKKLIHYAEIDRKALLVAHGFLNRYLVKYLKKQGWTLVKNGGKDYLSVSVLIRIENENNN